MISNQFTKIFALIIIFYLSSFGQIVNAQSNTCLIHDHHCINHGIGRLVGTVPSDTTSISATANWDQDNDIDLHVLAPAGPSYSAPLEALPGFPLNITAPFFPDVTGAHVYPNHYQSEIDGGVATITHSGDDGQGLATYPDQPGCLNQTGVSCENITVEGAVPGGVYSYALHAFPGTNTAFPPTQYDLEIQASGNLVLVMEEADQGNLTGVMEGTGSQSARIDVYAVNVGHSGHMGGVTLPEYEQYIRADGMVSYRPAEPDDPSISPYFVQNTIKEQFNARDEYVAQLDFLRDQEVERRRRVYLAYLAEQERLRQAKLKEELAIEQSIGQYSRCNPLYASCLPNDDKKNGSNFLQSRSSIFIENYAYNYLGSSVEQSIGNSLGRSSLAYQNLHGYSKLGADLKSIGRLPKLVFNNVQKNPSKLFGNPLQTIGTTIVSTGVGEIGNQQYGETGRIISQGTTDTLIAGGFTVVVSTTAAPAVVVGFTASKVLETGHAGYKTNQAIDSANTQWEKGKAITREYLSNIEDEAAKLRVLDTSILSAESQLELNSNLGSYLSGNWIDGKKARDSIKDEIDYLENKRDKILSE